MKLPATIAEAKAYYSRILKLAIKSRGPEDTREIQNIRRDRAMARLGRADLYYLLRYLCGREDMEHPWLFARCREVQADPNGHLELWGRDHRKSTIVTFGLSIQELLNNPETTIGIFSHTRPISTKFLNQIKTELTINEDLKRIYPDVLWQDPEREAPVWSESGIVVKRKTNPKEATVEAHGLVEGQPTSRHFRVRVYDDVVVEASVTTKEQIEKTTLAWENSLNLGMEGGVARYVGTRWSLYDTYDTMMRRRSVKPRIHATTDNGRFDGKPVFFSKQRWEEVKRDQSRKTIAAQHLMNPLADGQATFRVEWLKPYEIRPRTLNVYIMGDPSKGRNRGNDNTAIAVIGMPVAGGKYLLDGYAHRMPMSKRWTYLRDLYKKWSAMPGVQHVGVGWERFGMQTDEEYFEERMREEKIPFAIQELSWTREGNESKENRVERLEPDFRNGRFYLPLNVWKEGKPSIWEVKGICEACTHPNKPDDKTCAKCGHDKWSAYKIEYREVEELTRAQRDALDNGSGDLIAKALKRKDEEGNVYDLAERLLDEYESFPFSLTDDILDACSRIYDMDATPAVIVRREETEPPLFHDS